MVYNIGSSDWSMFFIYMLWFKFFEPVPSLFSFVSDYMVMHLTQREITIKLVQKFKTKNKFKPQHAFPIIPLFVIHGFFTNQQNDQLPVSL